MSDARTRGIARMLAAIRAHDTDPDPFEIEAQDELPYVQLGHWVGLADISARAKELYWILAMHLNYRRGDRYVWPSTEILAMLLGYSRGDKITPFTRELEDIGALTVIKVPDGRGPQRKNVYKLRRTPPEGYAGPRSIGEFYERLGKAYDGEVLEELQRLNSIKTAGQVVTPKSGGDVSPQLRAHVSPQARGDVGPQFGAVTTRSLNKKKRNSEKAPAARSAGDARRATTGSSARETSGCATSNGADAPKTAAARKTQVRMSREQAQAVRTIEQRFPAELAAKMPGYRPPALRDAILAALGDAPDQRTGDQLAERLERRWYSWGFAEKHRQGEINSYPGVAIRLLSTQPCGSPRCEDGQDVDDGTPCGACVERGRDRRREYRSGVLPRSRAAGGRNHDPAPGWWECDEPSCRLPGKGLPPDDGLCPNCRASAAEAAAVASRLSDDLDQLEKEQHDRAPRRTDG